jgi:hypothetical protein
VDRLAVAVEKAGSTFANTVQMRTRPSSSSIER